MKFAKWMEKANTEKIMKLARKVDCHYLYLYQVAKYGCSPGLAKKIEKTTKAMDPRRVVHKWELRPDIWEKEQ